MFGGADNELSSNGSSCGDRLRFCGSCPDGLVCSIPYQGGGGVETIIGEALMWLFRNRDFLVILASFTVGVGVIHTLFAIRDYYEGG